MIIVILSGGMLGSRSRLRPLPLSIVGWYASCNSNNNNNNNKIISGVIVCHMILINMMQKNHRNLDNDVNVAGSVSEGLWSGRCSVEQQHRPGRNHVTAVITRMKWTKEVNVIVMECFYLSK